MFGSNGFSIFALFTLLLASGCEQKEKVLDVETPRSEIEIERSKDMGDVDITIDRDRK